MNKDVATTYALIEDMALNHYHWTDEKTLVVSLPSKKEAGINKISSFDHLSAKVDALSQKFDKINISAVTPTSILPPCGACGSSGHTSIDCKPGSVVENIEQMNFVQNNQGINSNKTFHKNLQNPFGLKTPPPDYVNEQSIFQNYSLELFMENYLSNQTEQLQELENQTRLLNDSLAKITSKVDSVSSHNKILEAQISHANTNKMNSVTLRNGKQLEGPIGKANPSEIERENSEPQVEEIRVESKKQIGPPPFKPKIPFPQRFAKSKLDEQFKKFIEMMNKIYIDVPFTDVLTQMPTYAKFLKEILSKKTKIEEDETVNLTEECSAIILNKLPPKPKDPGSFSIPCVIGSEVVKKAMCDFGSQC